MYSAVPFPLVYQDNYINVSREFQQVPTRPGSHADIFVTVQEGLIEVMLQWESAFYSQPILLMACILKIHANVNFGGVALTKPFLPHKKLTNSGCFALYLF